MLAFKVEAPKPQDKTVFIVFGPPRPVRRHGIDFTRNGISTTACVHTITVGLARPASPLLAHDSPSQIGHEIPFHQDALSRQSPFVMHILATHPTTIQPDITTKNRCSMIAPPLLLQCGTFVSDLIDQGIY